MKPRNLISALLSSLLLISTAASASVVYMDIAGQGADPGSLYLTDEHGLAGDFGASRSAEIAVQSYNSGTGTWTVSITNTSGSTMENTVLALENNASMGFHLTDQTWDGWVGTDPAYYFGTILAGMTATREISVTGLPDPLVIRSPGPDNLNLGTNASIYHTPEPGSVSLTLAALSIAGLAQKLHERKHHA